MKKSLISFINIFEGVLNVKSQPQTRQTDPMGHCCRSILFRRNWYFILLIIWFSQVSFPMDLVKVRLQLQNELSTQPVEGKTFGFFGMFKKVLKNEGFFSLFKGSGAAALRQVIYGGISIGMYKVLTQESHHLLDIQGVFIWWENNHLISSTNCCFSRDWTGRSVGRPAPCMNLLYRSNES